METFLVLLDYPTGARLEVSYGYAVIIDDDPTIPSQPDLIASDDSGQSDSDNITRDTTVRSLAAEGP